MKKVLLCLLAYITASTALWATNYELVTSKDGLEVGANYIITSGTGSSVNALGAISNSVCTIVPVTVTNNNVVSKISTATVLTLSKEGGSYQLKVGENYLASSAAKKMTSSSILTNACNVSISFSSDAVVISYASNVGNLQYNSGSPRFTTYTSNQGKIYLFKEVKEEPITGVAAPKFSVEGGIYNNPQSVEISCKTANATIYYTLDGTDPKESETKATYSEALSISNDCKLRAIATNGTDYSEELSADYTFKVAFGLSFNVQEGQEVYPDKVVGTPTYTTTDAKVYYTIDGTDPKTSSTRIEYADADGQRMDLRSSCTLKVVAYSESINGGSYSDVVEKSFNILAKMPVFTPAGGEDVVYYAPVTVTISGVEASEPMLCYTTNGETPQLGVDFYEGAFEVTKSGTVVKAVASLDGITPSAINSTVYIIKAKTPVFSVEAGSYTEAQSVELTAEGAAAIYYTTDGTEPTKSSTLYDGAISVSETTTIKAIAYDAYDNASDVAEAEYKIVLPSPTFTPAAGRYNTTQKVTIECATEGATIYYTTDGTTPTKESTPFTTPIEVAESMTIKAIAYDAEGKSSDVVEAVYSIVSELQILFAASGTGDSNIKLTTETFCEQIVDGKDYVTSCDAVSAVVAGKNGIKFGSANSGGSFTVTLDKVYNIKSIKAAIAKYNEKDKADITINEVTNSLTTQSTDVVVTYEYNYDNAEPALQLTVSSNKRFYLSGLTIVYDGDPQEVVATPTFSLAEGTYDNIKNVTISSATEGASIYYTTDGTEPTEESTLYTGAVTVDKSMTLKAVACHEGYHCSKVASVKYVITAITSVEAYKALALNSDVTMRCSLTVTGSKTSTNTRGDSFLYAVDDNNDPILIFKENGGLPNFENGTKLLSGISGNKQKFDKMEVLYVDASTVVADETAELAPVAPKIIYDVKEIDTKKDINRYVEIYSANVSGSKLKLTTTSADNPENTVGQSPALRSIDTTNNAISFFKRYDDVTIPADGTMYQIVYGFIGEYNGDVQIYPTLFEVNVTTGIDGVNSDNVKVVAGEGVITVAGDAKNVAVYTTNGMLISKGENVVNCVAGVYVVTVNGKAHKVVVK